MKEMLSTSAISDTAAIREVYYCFPTFSCW